VSLPILAVSALAGGAGSAARVLVRDALARRGVAPRWTVLGINLAGSLAIGLVSGAVGREGSGGLAPAATVGLLAGWTTYSAFCMDVVLLWIRGERVRAGSLWAATLLGSTALAMAGAWTVRATSWGVP
jgi:CrcB protein